MPEKMERQRAIPRALARGRWEGSLEGRRGEARSGKESAARRAGLLQQQLRCLVCPQLSHKPRRRKMPSETGLTRPAQEAEAAASAGQGGNAQDTVTAAEKRGSAEREGERAPEHWPWAGSCSQGEGQASPMARGRRRGTRQGRLKGAVGMRRF